MQTTWRARLTKVIGSFPHSKQGEGGPGQKGIVICEGVHIYIKHREG